MCYIVNFLFKTFTIADRLILQIIVVDIMIIFVNHLTKPNIRTSVLPSDIQAPQLLVEIILSDASLRFHQ